MTTAAVIRAANARGPLLFGGRVHVWHGMAPRHAAPGDWAVLSEAERRRAERFVDRAETAGYVHCHATVRRVLAGYLGVAPRELCFGRHTCPGCGDGDHGKPRVSAPPTALSFNHSRSGPAWLLAVAPGGHRVGADVERVRPLAGGGVPRSCLTGPERAFVAAAGDASERLARFFRCWTRKEAAVKATGLGVAAGLAGVETHGARPGTVATVRVDGRGGGRFRLVDLRLAHGLAACVAIDLAALAEGAGTHPKDPIADSSGEPKTSTADADYRDPGQSCL